LSLESLSNLVKYFQVRTGAYPTVEHLKRLWPSLKILDKTRNACYGQMFVLGKPFRPSPILSGKVRSLPKSRAEKALALPEKLHKARKPFQPYPIVSVKVRSLP
jgi:hypothetical protein